MGRERKFRVWEEAMELTVDVMRATQRFPKRYQWSLGNQMDRAAISIASNIAEGAESGSDRRFANYLNIARGSAAELRTQLMLAHRLDLPTPESAIPTIDQIRRKLLALQKSLNT